MKRKVFLKKAGLTTITLANFPNLIKSFAVDEAEGIDLLALYESGEYTCLEPYNSKHTNGWQVEYWGCEGVEQVTIGSPLSLSSPEFKISHAGFLYCWPGEHMDNVAVLEINEEAKFVGLIDENWRCWDLSAYVGSNAVFRIYDVKRHKPETRGGVKAFFMPRIIEKFPTVPQNKDVSKISSLLPTFLSYKPESNQCRVQEIISDYSEKYRPQFHFTRNHGWMNDPNGLVYYKGEYHLFMQAQNFWGHAVSKDLVHWQQINDAFGTDNLGAAWSGSSVIDWDNTSGFKQGDEPPMVAIYTSCGNARLNPKESMVRLQFQSLAYSNDRGRTWEKYENNPVLRHLHRDPKVFWHEPTKKWVMALMLRLNGTGFFTSSDLKNWKKESVCTEWEGECPDFFPLKIEGVPQTIKWVGVNASGKYWVGNFDGKTFTPESKALRIEYGRNFYATQTFNNAPEGRIIQMTWMNAHNQWGWKTGAEGVEPSGKYPGNPFSQQITFPRELTLRKTPEGLRMYSNPVKEIGNIYNKTHRWKNITVNPGENPLKEFDHDLYDITAIIEPLSSTEFGFIIAGEKISINTGTGKIECRNHFNTVNFDEKIKLRLLIDRISIEIFVNDGEKTMTYSFFPKDNNEALSLYTKGGSVNAHQLIVHELNSIWQ